MTFRTTIGNVTVETDTAEEMLALVRPGVSARPPAPVAPAPTQTKPEGASESAQKVRANQCPGPRQTEVARLARAGRQVREIAEQLGMSPKTVQVHLSMLRGRG